MQVLTLALIVAATFSAIWTGIHFGSKWIDKMLRYEPLDPNKPIVRKER